MARVKKYLYAVCVLVFLLGAWKFWVMSHAEEENENIYDVLKTEAQSNHAAPPEVSAEAPDEQTPVPDDITAGFDTSVNPWLNELKTKNEDTIGWLTVPDTAINYPVMYRSADDDYYITHDFNRERNKHGVPFLDARCNIDTSTNLIFYGHNMADGTMFENLERFYSADFCENSGRIRLDTVYETTYYEVIFSVVISEKETEDFPYYAYIDMSDTETYNYFLKKCREYAVWSSDEMPEPGTRLITLSTCEYSKQNGRLVVIGKCVESVKVDKPESNTDN